MPFQAFPCNAIAAQYADLLFHCSDTLRFSLALTRLTLPSNSYAYQHTVLPWRFLSCLFGSLASHITPMPCPGISIPVTALPSLRLSVQCHSNPGLSFRSRCISFPFHSVPSHLRTVICFATAYLRHTLPWHFDHRNSFAQSGFTHLRLYIALFAIPLHTTLCRHESLQGCALPLRIILCCAVASPVLSILCLRHSSRFRTLPCRCIAL